MADIEKHSTTEGECAICHSENIEWGDSGMVDMNYYFEFSCQDCGAQNTEWHELKFVEVVGHGETEDNNYKKPEFKVTDKASARDMGIEYQLWASEQNLSYGELIEWTEYLTKIAKRYGLLKEFREEGII